MKKIIAVLLLTGSPIVMAAADGSAIPTTEDGVFRRARAGSMAISSDEIGTLKQLHAREIEQMQDGYLTQLQTLTDQLTRTRGMMGSVSKARDQLQLKNEELTHALAAKEESSKLVGANRDMLVQTLLGVREDNAALKTAMEKLQQKAAENAALHEGVMNELHMAVETAEAALEKETTKSRNAEEENARLAAELEAQARDFNDLQEINAHEIETLTSQILQLKEHVARLAKERNTSMLSADVYMAELEDQKIINTKLEEALQCVHAQFSSLMLLLHEKARELETTSHQLKIARTIPESLQSSLWKSELQKVALKTQIKALEKRNGKYKRGRRHHPMMRLGVPQ